MLAFAAGCAHAGVLTDGVFRADDFTVGHPGTDWKTVRNRRVGSNVLVGFRHVEDPVDISVNEVEITDEETEIPVIVLAESLFQNVGRKRGIETTLEQGKRVDIGEHEAFVVVGTRTNQASTRRVAQLFLRAGHRLFVFSYIAPPDLYDSYAAYWGNALEDFAVLLPADPPEMALPSPPAKEKPLEQPPDHGG